MEVSFVIIVGVFLKSGSQIIHPSLGQNFHPSPGGVAIGRQRGCGVAREMTAKQTM